MKKTLIEQSVLVSDVQSISNVAHVLPIAGGSAAIPHNPVHILDAVHILGSADTATIGSTESTVGFGHTSNAND